MKSTVDELVTRLDPPFPNLVRRHAEVLNSTDSRFSDVALRLFTETKSDTAERYVRIMLSKYIDTKIAFDGTLSRVGFRKRHFGARYTAAHFVLDDAISARSVATMVLPEGYELYSMIQAASAGDFHLVSTHTIARPDMLGASTKELNDYYRPIAVAGILLDINTDEQRFIEDAPAFLTWVAEQENLDEVLSAALQAKSLDPHTIEAIANMRNATPSALHSGLI